MIDGLKPYPEMKDSGVPSIGEIPAHWSIRRLRNLADMRVSSIDKLTRDGEPSVRLCNYTDVYKNDRITSTLPFMSATASSDELRRYRLEVGDVLITKDSEAWDDIGVPAVVEETADDLVSGYHLAILRPRKERVIGPYLFRAIQSRCVTVQMHVLANGVTRYALSHGAIKSIWVPNPPIDEQAAIVAFLDHADHLIGRYIRLAQSLVGGSTLQGGLLREYGVRMIADIVAGKLDVRSARVQATRRTR